MAPDAAAAQARGNSSGKAKATERFENRDRRGNDRRDDARASERRRDDARALERRRNEERRIAEQRRDERTRLEARRRYEEQRRWEERRRYEDQRRWEEQRRRSGTGIVWPRDGRDNRDWDRDRDWDRNRSNAPAFCRSGAGHPVHGRQWCVRKGYGLGTRDRWDRAGWDDIIFGRRDRRYDDRSLGRSVLGDILGRTMLGRLDTQSRYVGGGTLNGRWLDQRTGPLILQVFAGRTPLAEFVDENRDGRTDFVMLNRGTR